MNNHPENSRNFDPSCGKFFDVMNYAEKCQNCSGYEEKIQKKMNNSMTSEIAEMEKHELICKMAAMLGSDANSLSQAESLFNRLKYQITEYVLKHEYNYSHSLPVNISLWLEQQKEPKAIKPLNNLIQTYLK